MSIEEVVGFYFEGTYEANADKLKRAFHPDCHINGKFHGEYVDWTREQFVERICSRESEASEGALFDKQIVEMDVTHDIASVKAKVLGTGQYFIDYITLVKMGGEWVIRNKTFITV
tara:strand:+ start:94260 stop:94607 length:348 start_codon:yes stop_codon:yes gene_type:complete